MWHENPGPAAQQTAPTVRYTRNPPSPRWLKPTKPTSLDDVAGFTPDQDAAVFPVHEAAHAVMFMAAGRAIDYITVFPPGSAQDTANAKAHTQPVDARGEWTPWIDYAIVHAARAREDRDELPPEDTPHGRAYRQFKRAYQSASAPWPQMHTTLGYLSEVEDWDGIDAMFQSAAACHNAQIPPGELRAFLTSAVKARSRTQAETIDFAALAVLRDYHKNR